MDDPSELLRRAARNRRSVPARPAAPEGENPPPGDEARRPEPRAGHGAYGALMRRHDRMRTCHLPVQSGDGRA